MTLAARQQAFMASVLDDEAALPDSWTLRHRAGIEIYRNNYRSALVEAIGATFERTRRWVGEESFRRAAAHHLILHPPAGWTIDDAGEGFERTLAELFTGDPEVAELGALEWAMHRAFIATDTIPLDSTALAAETADFTEDDWAGLRIGFRPGVALLAVTHDVGTLWQALASDDFSAPSTGLQTAHRLVVWREDLRPTFRLLDPLGGEMLDAAMAGACFGDICAILAERLGDEQGIARAGFLLGQWLQDGLIAALRR